MKLMKAREKKVWLENNDKEREKKKEKKVRILELEKVFIWLSHPQKLLFSRDIKSNHLCITFAGKVWAKISSNSQKS